MRWFLSRRKTVRVVLGLFRCGSGSGVKWIAAPRVIVFAFPVRSAPAVSASRRSSARVRASWCIVSRCAIAFVIEFFRETAGHGSFAGSVGQGRAAVRVLRVFAAKPVLPVRSGEPGRVGPARSGSARCSLQRGIWSVQRRRASRQPAGALRHDTYGSRRKPCHRRNDPLLQP
jgi:hypothetical protein